MRKNMKKILFTAFFTVILFALGYTCSFANSAQSAETINVNDSKSYTFSENVSEHYYTFTPSEGGYYEINVSNFVTDETYIEVTNIYGDDVAFEGWNQYANRVFLACRLEAGNTYYIRTSAYTGVTRTITTTLTKHNHQYKPAEGSNGFYYQECSTPSCNFTAYVIKNKPVFKTLSKGKKKFTAKWKNSSVAIDGFEIQYSRSKSFAPSQTSSAYASWAKKSKTVKGLKKNKKYYVRIRSFYNCTEWYNDVATFYSPWSKVKKIKVR